jgi:hypothetical protein
MNNFITVFERPVHTFDITLSILLFASWQPDAFSSLYEKNIPVHCLA